MQTLQLTDSRLLAVLDTQTQRRYFGLASTGKATPRGIAEKNASSLTGNSYRKFADNMSRGATPPSAGPPSEAASRAIARELLMSA